MHIFFAVPLLRQAVVGALAVMSLGVGANALAQTTAPAVPVVAAPAAASAPAFAQRDVAQQTRIEKGLESGQLNTREAAKLEAQQSHVDALEAKALKDGKLTAAERTRIKTAQDRASSAIAREKHDAQTGNPGSVSSQRMQADVQRNVNQDKRIAQGLSSGALTKTEAAKLEAGQAHVTAVQAQAGADGHVSAAEQKHVQAAQNAQSHKIYRQKHDAQKKVTPAN